MSKKDLAPNSQLLAGMTSGVTTVLLLHPLDLIRCVHASSDTIPIFGSLPSSLSSRLFANVWAVLGSAGKLRPPSRCSPYAASMWHCVLLLVMVMVLQLIALNVLDLVLYLLGERQKTGSLNSACVAPDHPCRTGSPWLTECAGCGSRLRTLLGKAHGEGMSLCD
jgi:hypothetical protein